MRVVEFVVCGSDNHFDVPDRTFHSLERCYQLVTMQSVTDTKELIPEFFYLPEFFENREGRPSCLYTCILIGPWKLYK